MGIVDRAAWGGKWRYLWGVKVRLGQLTAPTLNWFS